METWSFLRCAGAFPCREKSIVFILLSVLIFVCLVPAAWSQAPDGTLPGRIEKRFEQPLVPKSQPKIHLRSPRQVPPDKAGQIQFVLTGVEFEGNTVFKSSELKRFYENFLSKKIALNDIYLIADAITAFYRNEGYILCTAIVPPQEITDGVVRIRIVEGAINDIRIEGDIRGRKSLFDQWAAKIKASRPLNIKVLERYTLLANDLPGATVKTVLRPAKDTPGGTDLLLVVEHRTFDASAGYDNRGIKTSGPGQFTFAAGENSLLKLYEKTNLMYVASDDFTELNYLVLSHEETLTSEGTKLMLSANSSQTRPGDHLKDFDIKGQGTTFGIGLTHPFLRTRTANFSANLDFLWKDSHTTMLDQFQSEDRLRVLKAGATYDFSDRLGGVNLINVEIHQGLNILGARTTGSEGLTRAEGYSDFTKVTADISRTQKIVERLGLVLSGQGQYALCPLLASEEFGYGGAQFGRGYDSSEITGDHGFAFKGELQFTDNLRSRYLETLKFYQVYAFADYGEVYGKSDLKSKHDSGASAGVGIRFALTDHLAGYLEVDKPLTRPVAAVDPDHGYDPRIFFSLVARY